MNYIDIIKNGIVKENPTFVLMLGMCPTLATTTSALNGMSMGLATMAVLICTNFVISCLKSATPDKVRIPVFIVVIAAFVTVLQLRGVTLRRHRHRTGLHPRTHPAGHLSRTAGLRLHFRLRAAA